MQGIKYIFLHVCLLLATGVFAQTALLYNGKNVWEGVTMIILSALNKLLDGGYIVAGKSYSNDSDVSGNHGSWDCWIVK